LFALNYLINFFAFGLPNLIKLLQTGEAKYFEQFAILQTEIGILVFAGITFLMFALKEKLRMQTVHLVLFTLVISCLNFLLAVPVENFLLGQSAGIFAYVTEIAYFPFLSWVGYPVMGYVFGAFLKRCTDKKRFYRHILAFSGLIIIVMSLGLEKYGFNMWQLYLTASDAYFFQDFIQYFLVGGIAFVWISVLYFISRLKFLDFFGKQLSRWSRNVTIMYFAHYVIIGWLWIVVPLEFSNAPYVILLTSIAVLLLSDAIAILYQKFFGSVRR
jgi:hypothetical protein